MKTTADSEFLPPGVAARLSRITTVARRSVLMEYAARVTGVFVLVAVTAMTADAGFRLFHPLARWLISLTVVAALAWAGIRWWKRMAGRRSPAAAAWEAERSVPGLEERWSTLASLNEPKNREIRGAPGLIEKVREEAARFVRAVPVRSVESNKRVNRSIIWTALGCGLLAVFYVADPGRAGVLWQRLLAPWSDASLTKIQVISHHVEAVVPRHEVCELQASLSGRPVDSAILFLDQAGTVSGIPIDADRLAPVPFKHVLRDPVDDFAFRFRAGDGQTVWHRVRVADRPFIQAATMTVTPPAYTGKEAENHPGIPPRLRVLEGSGLTVKVAPGLTSDESWLVAGSDDGKRLPFDKRDGAYRIISLSADRSTRFFPLLISAEGLENRMPPVCELEVVPDQAPVVTLTEDSTIEAITPADTIEVAFSATDDVGVEEAEIVVTVEKKGSPPQEFTVPINLGADQGSRNVNRRVPLDLSKLPLEPDAKISYAVRVKDGRAVAAEAAQKKQEALAKSDSEAPAGKDGKGGKDEKGADDKAPPVTMGKRELDLAGCSCSGAKNLDIEGYTGNPPDWRDKNSLPVMPALTKIRDAAMAALEQASGARSRMKPGKAPEALLTGIRLSEAKTGIAEKESSVFTALTKNTPYAVIGLDVESLRTRELVPARDALVAVPEAADAIPKTNEATMHLRAAVAWLERIMAKAEKAAQQQEAAALAQKIKEMHRIFLEDSLALLKLADGKNSGVPALPLIEVDRRYAELVEKMEKAKAEIMKQFAALLEKDPELMARFNINRGKGADDFQAQAATLVREQESLNRRTRNLADGKPADSVKAASEFLTDVSSRQLFLIGQLGTLMRSATAFFPKRIPRDGPEATGFFDTLLNAASLPPADNDARVKAVSELMESLNSLSMLDGGASWAAKQRRTLTDIKLQQEWLVELANAVKAGRTSRAAGLVQRDVERRTRILAAKIDRELQGMVSVMPAIRPTAATIQTAFSTTAIPSQDSAAGSLQKGAWKPAGPAQLKALEGLNAASRGCTELVNLIAEEMKKNPPPPPIAGEMPPPPSLESLMAMMESEAEAEEGFSLPQWKLNVELIKDWLTECKDGAGSPGGKPGKEPGKKPGEKPGDKDGEKPADPPGEKPGPNPEEKPGNKLDPAMAGQMKAAAEQARAMAAAAAKVQQEANARAKQLAEAGSPETDGAANPGTAKNQTHRDDWNKLPSELNKDIRQQQDSPPPEEYRHAVETYFRRIGAGQDGVEVR